VIWSRGDGEMPDKVQYVVEAARGELLLQTLQLPNEIVDLILYNADKKHQTVNGYLSGIVIERIKSVSWFSEFIPVM